MAQGLGFARWVHVPIKHIPSSKIPSSKLILRLATLGAASMFVRIMLNENIVLVDQPLIRFCLQLLRRLESILRLTLGLPIT